MEEGHILKIFCFIWNTQSVRLSESLNPLELTEHRNGFLASYQFSAEIPDFFPSLMEKIKTENPDLVIIGFQEDASPGSYFHSHLLPTEMPKYMYTLVKRTRLMGVGDTTYQALLSLDFKMRGLRLSIYAKEPLATQILEEEDILSHDIGETQQEYVCSTIFRNKGGTASYIRIPRVGTIAIINAHLPFNSKSLMESAVRHDPIIRVTEVQNQNIWFNQIYKHLVLDLKVQPDYVLYMGDFNYRNKPNPGAFAIAGALESRGCKELYKEIYLNCDELYDAMHIKGNIYKFKEGINDEGPMFLPTCKMSKTRQEGYDKGLDGHRSLEEPYVPNLNNPSRLCFKTGICNQRCPSWTDRIFYSTLNDKLKSLECTYYERFDVGKTMKKSDHAGVIGVFVI